MRSQQKPRFLLAADEARLCASFFAPVNYSAPLLRNQ
jgi:hypothetical protein